jgi:hypothetical protein
LAEKSRGVQRRGAGEVENRDLEEQDPEDQHVQAVQREDAVEPVDAQQVDGLPAGEREQDGGEAADQQEDDGTDGVELDEALGVEADVEARGVALAGERTGRIGRGGRRRWWRSRTWRKAPGGG